MRLKGCSAHREDHHATEVGVRAFHDLPGACGGKLSQTVDRSVPFSAWLFRIAHNLLIDHFRVAKRTTPEEELEHPDMAEASAEDEAMTVFGRESMLKLIGGLSCDQQQVLTLKFGLDFSNGEIATILGKSEGAVKALQHRAICTLEQRVDQRQQMPLLVLVAGGEAPPAAVRLRLRPGGTTRDRSNTPCVRGRSSLGSAAGAGLARRSPPSSAAARSGAARNGTPKRATPSPVIAGRSSARTPG